MAKKKKKQKDYCLLDRNDIRRRQRKLYSNLLELVEGIVGEALIDNDISASKLQSLLRSLAWLKEEEGKLRPEDFSQESRKGPTPGEQKMMDEFVEEKAAGGVMGRAEAEFREKYGSDGMDEVMISGKLSDANLKY